MSEATSARPAPTTLGRRSPAPAGRARLRPEEPFPTELAELELWLVQVLHSKICCQLEAEYCTVEGPHPVTLDRCEELREELETRRHVPIGPTTGR